jgi:hypothetical protein
MDIKIMSEIVLPAQSCSAHDLLPGSLLDNFFSVNNLTGNGRLQAFKPYAVPDNNRETNKTVELLTWLPQQSRVKLTQAAGEMGDLTMAISDFYNDRFLGTKQGDWQSLAGAGLGAMGTRTSNFVNTLTSYQSALLDLRVAAKNKMPRIELSKLEMQAKNLHNTLASQFRSELKHFEATNRARRGTVMSSSKRAINIAKSARKSTSLHVTDLKQAQRLAKFSGAVKHVGRGLVVLDVDWF